ncbi:cytochrome P450 6B2-like [Ostrinia nubilalis]|uniref:cytochrome P450 6B2-like n=1 Tax=Ostrinia nubilalis TaxID=29057 RepID=UPI00308243F3
MFALILLAVVLVAIYLYNTRTFSYWAKKGVKYEKPVVLFGNNSRNFLMQRSRSQMVEEWYWKYPDEKAVGYYRSTTPELIVRDPELVKEVLISGFSHFYARGFHPYPKVIEPVLRHLFIVEGDLWKMLRQRMTPAFTSGKLKVMFPMIVEKAEKLQIRVLAASKSGAALDARDLMARFTTDFIGCCGFGLDGNSLNDEDSDFRRLGFDIFNVTFKDFVVTVLKAVFPALCQNLKFTAKLEDRVFNLVNQVQESRGYKPSGRGDFIDLLLEYKEKGPITIESIEKFLPDGTPERVTMELDNVLVVAQVFLFFAGGFETSSSTTSYTLHQLAYNPEVQKKVQKEIDEVLAKYNNKLSYDAVKDMTYLDWAFKESMRMFPAVGYLLRRCVRQYTFKNMDLTVDPGVRMLVPVTALHMDPQYWDNPKEFRPERHHPDEFTSKQKAVFFPFGEGPRNCIGTRLGQMQSLAGLAAILSRFSVEPAPGSVRFPQPDPTSDIVQSPKGGKLPLIFKDRKASAVNGF